MCSSSFDAPAFTAHDEVLGAVEKLEAKLHALNTAELAPQISTEIEFPRMPGHFAAKAPIDSWPSAAMLSYCSRFLIRTPEVPECPDVAFRAAAATARTALRLLLYFKYEAAVKNERAVTSVGVPNTEASSFSELTVRTSSTGPQLKAPTYPPIEAETEGTTLVRSISLI